MHGQNITHKEIRPEKIQIKNKNVDCFDLKISDFGFAKYYNSENGGFKDTQEAPLYMAPEIVMGESYDCSADIWSLGILTYIMLSGRQPYSGKTTE